MDTYTCCELFSRWVKEVQIIQLKVDLFQLIGWTVERCKEHIPSNFNNRWWTQCKVLIKYLLTENEYTWKCDGFQGQKELTKNFPSFSQTSHTSERLKLHTEKKNGNMQNSH